MPTLKSEFRTYTSQNAADFVPMDFAGAREVMIQIEATTADGLIVNEPYANSEGLKLYAGNVTPIRVASSDDRLYFVSGGASVATVYVWIVRG